MADPRFNQLESPMLERGFVREGNKRKGDALWVHMQAEVIQYEVSLGDSDWNPGHFGCSIRVRYAPLARRSWPGPDWLFFYDIVRNDFLPRGLDDAGTPGAACWPYTNIPGFFVAFDRDVMGVFRRFTNLRELAEECRLQYEERPKAFGLIEAGAFAHFDLGERDAARKLFDEYFEKMPGKKSWYAPSIDALFR